MQLSLDHASPEPPYEQIVAQVKAAVAAGQAPPGTKLPTIRGLASELNLAVNTVAKAFRALEADGLIETRGRFGSVVKASQGSLEKSAHAAAAACAAEMMRLGIPSEKAVELVKAAFEEKR